VNPGPRVHRDKSIWVHAASTLLLEKFGHDAIKTVEYFLTSWEAEVETEDGTEAEAEAEAEALASSNWESNH
jgi:hypothetical protein